MNKKRNGLEVSEGCITALVFLPCVTAAPDGGVFWSKPSGVEATRRQQIFRHGDIASEHEW